MSIRNDSKKIVNYFLEKAVECGDLDMFSSNFSFSYDSLATTLDLKDGKYCRICCQYLVSHGYITVNTKEEEYTDVLSVQRRASLSGSAIDFLETD